MKETNPRKGHKCQKGINNGSKYDTAFRQKVARHYLENNLSQQRVGQIYNVCRQLVYAWTKEFSSELSAEILIKPMTEQEQQEVEALKKQVETLKKKLEYEQMKNFALETMADLAKTELGIDIRKNSGAKQPKE